MSQMDVVSFNPVPAELVAPIPISSLCPDRGVQEESRLQFMGLVKRHLSLIPSLGISHTALQ